MTDIKIKQEKFDPDYGDIIPSENISFSHNNEIYRHRIEDNLPNRKRFRDDRTQRSSIETGVHKINTSIIIPNKKVKEEKLWEDPKLSFTKKSKNVLRLCEKLIDKLHNGNSKPYSTRFFYTITQKTQSDESKDENRSLLLRCENIQFDYSSKSRNINHKSFGIWSPPEYITYIARKMEFDTSPLYLKFIHNEKNKKVELVSSCRAFASTQTNNDEICEKCALRNRTQACENDDDLAFLDQFRESNDHFRQATASFFKLITCCPYQKDKNILANDLFRIYNMAYNSANQEDAYFTNLNEYHNSPFMNPQYMNQTVPLSTSNTQINPISQGMYMGHLAAMNQQWSINPLNHQRNLFNSIDQTQVMNQNDPMNEYQQGAFRFRSHQHAMSGPSGMQAPQRTIDPRKRRH